MPNSLNFSASKYHEIVFGFIRLYIVIAYLYIREWGPPAPSPSPALAAPTYYGFPRCSPRQIHRRRAGMARRCRWRRRPLWRHYGSVDANGGRDVPRGNPHRHVGTQSGSQTRSVGPVFKNILPDVGQSSNRQLWLIAGIRSLMGTIQEAAWRYLDDKFLIKLRLSKRKSGCLYKEFKV